jgi:hypothetical protein
LIGLSTTRTGAALHSYLEGPEKFGLRENKQCSSPLHRDEHEPQKRP